MEKAVSIAKGAAAALGAWAGTLLGGVDGLVYALLIFVITDYITGVLAAAYKNKLSSSVGFWGLAKKVMIFLLIAVGHTVDAHILKHGAAVRTAIIFFYLANEGLSMMENYASLGLPFPDKLKAALSQLGEKGDGKDDDK